MELMVWKKSTRSGAYGDNCAECMWDGTNVHIRDTKNPDGATLKFTRGEWDAFVGGAQEGEFRLP